MQIAPHDYGLLLLFFGFFPEGVRIYFWASFFFSLFSFLVGVGLKFGKQRQVAFEITVRPSFKSNSLVSQI